MAHQVICLSRQFGSGGREIGRRLAQRLGIAFYDRELIEETARKAGVSVDEVMKSEERRAGSLLYFGGIPASNPLFDAQSEAIMDIASKGPCVFVGRCADYVLRNRGDVVNVFITAPVPDRIRRSAERNSISERNAYERIKRKDDERAEYYRRHTGRVWGSVSNYNLSVDTGSIGVENAAKLILDYIRMAYPDQ